MVFEGPADLDFEVLLAEGFSKQFHVLSEDASIQIGVVDIAGCE
jgi:hypothetical protein